MINLLYEQQKKIFFFLLGSELQIKIAFGAFFIIARFRWVTENCFSNDDGAGKISRWMEFNFVESRVEMMEQRKPSGLINFQRCSTSISFRWWSAEAEDC